MRIYTFGELARKRWVWCVVAALVVVAGILYFLFDPNEVHIFPPCLFKLATGYDCPGCGSQRVIHSLLTGDFAAAVHYNAFISLFAIPFMVLYFVAWLLRKRVAWLYRAMSSLTMCVILIFVTAAWFFVRNFIMGPL